jgi:hypothetical protein
MYQENYSGYIVMYGFMSCLHALYCCLLFLTAFDAICVFKTARYIGRDANPDENCSLCSAGAVKMPSIHPATAATLTGGQTQPPSQNLLHHTIINWQSDCKKAKIDTVCSSAYIHDNTT